MKHMRSVSQILFGHLPQQTVDMGGRIWKVKEWRSPSRQPIDAAALRRELLRLIGPWERSGKDSNFAQHLRQGRDVTVYCLDKENGVSVEPFPKLWRCRTCSRVHRTLERPCKCGQPSGKFGQIFFVGFHDCGTLREPFIPACPEHKELRITRPDSASAAEITFDCPTCKRVLQQGFGFPPCSCGAGNITFMPHRTARVYTPRTVVVVNPPSSEGLRRIQEAGGQERALQWILDGLESKRIDDLPLTPEAALRDLVQKGFTEARARSIVQDMIAQGEIAENSAPIDLPPERTEAAGNDAITIAMALNLSRTRIRELAEASAKDGSTERSNTYRHLYPVAVARAGLEDVELVDRLPIITGNFAFTRGKQAPGEATLVPFMVRGTYAVHADRVETEALFVRLLPSRVARWLEARGHRLRAWSDERTARLAILAACAVPSPGDDPSTADDAGRALLTLVHSYAHRFIRRAAVFAGIERNGLAELLVPNHLGFFVYAATRGDFVLGGLQAVFEAELHQLLTDMATADHRCPLDPGCQDNGGACLACLHLGEPSCRYFNCYLDRDVLFGPLGYLRLRT